MEGMLNIMTMLAKSMPEEKILNDLKEAIIEYQINPNKKNKSGLDFNLIMASTSILTKGRDTKDVLDGLDKTQKGMDLLSPSPQ